MRIMSKHWLTVERAQSRGLLPKFWSAYVDIYGIIQDKHLREKAEEIRGLNYELDDPIVTFFNEIEDLQNFGIAANNEYYEEQFVKFGIHIIKNIGEFEHDLRIWHGMTRAKKTWNNSKAHFEAAPPYPKDNTLKNDEISIFSPRNYVGRKSSRRDAEHPKKCTISN